MKYNLKDFLRGREENLILQGEPSAQGMANLRKLDTLNLLSDDMVWTLLGQAVVDPLYLIRILREHKKELGFHPQEHLLQDSVAFLYGDETKDGFALSYHVNVFTNDIAIMVRHQGEQKVVFERTADLLFKLIEPAKVGEERLKLLLDTIKEQIKTALSKNVDRGLNV